MDGNTIHRAKVLCKKNRDGSMVIMRYTTAVSREMGWDLPGGTVVKNPPANAGDTDSSPCPGRSHLPRSN